MKKSSFTILTAMVLLLIMIMSGPINSVRALENLFHDNDTTDDGLDIEEETDLYVDQQGDRNEYDPIVILSGCNFTLYKDPSANPGIYEHMGRPDTKYRIDWSNLETAPGFTSADKDEFKLWLTQAALAWSPNISFTEDTSSNNVIKFTSVTLSDRSHECIRVDDNNEIIPAPDENADEETVNEYYARGHFRVASLDENGEPSNRSGVLPYATTQRNCSHITGHLTSWNITVSIDNFFNINVSNNERKHVLSHEIGHVYGLEHRNSDSTSIMRFDSGTILSPNDEDRYAMKVVTHRTYHRAVDFTYTDISSTKHAVLCIHCQHAYQEDPHAYGDAVDYSSTQHQRTCELCGHVGLTSHSYPTNWSDYSSTQHRKKCTMCSHYQYASHTWGSVEQYNSTQHRKKCTQCSRYQYASHTWGSVEQYNATQHRKKCTLCAQHKYENHSWLYSGGMLRCQTCGYEKPY